MSGEALDWGRVEADIVSTFYPTGDVNKSAGGRYYSADTIRAALRSRRDAIAQIILEATTEETTGGVGEAADAILALLGTEPEKEES